MTDKSQSKETAGLAERVRKLPAGTREADAYQKLGEGKSRVEFREVWLAERCQPVREHGKAVVETASKTGDD